MGVFYRRPLALFSLIFLLSALFAYDISISSIYFSLLVSITVTVSVAILAVIFKKSRMKLLVSAVCISAVIFGLLQSLIFIGIPTRKAEAYEGENTALCYVIDEIDEGQYGKKYNVKIKKIGDDSVNIRALLICGFDADIRGGDEIYGYAEITAQKGDEPNQLLTLYMENANNCYAKYSSQGKEIIGLLFSECGVEIVSGRISNIIKCELYSILGERSGSLAMGFFTGERSDIPADITRDFRRAGVSHLMAVSGSHVAILLGGIELILRKLQVHKNVRCCIITLFSIGFLFITGFSLSACRSVFMLYAVYLSYFLRESSDSITALFVSIAVIVFIFPYSIVDLGLWMSFLATLGLLTVYPIIEEKIPYPRKKPKIILLLLNWGRDVLLIAIMTVISNMFLLPIIWYYFKELSLVSVISNILITSLSSVFLLSVPILLMVSRIPLLGIVFRSVVSFLAKAVIFVVNACSRIPNATISLKYEFCRYIVWIFAISMVVFLFVRLKRKIFVLLPYGCAVISFVICFFVYGVFISSPTVTYMNHGKNEIFAVRDNTELSVCDGTLGGFYTYSEIMQLLKKSYATEIDNYIYTSYNSENITALELLSDKAIIYNIYLPTPQNDLETVRAQKLYELAKDKQIQVIFYNNSNMIELTDKIDSQILISDDKNKCLRFLSKERSVVYATPGYCSSNEDYDILIVGDPDKKDVSYNLENISANELYISSGALTKRLRLPSGVTTYIPKKTNYSIEFNLN